MSAQDLPLAEWRAWLRYEPETGDFYWVKAPSRKIRAGERAGSLKATGYVEIALRGNSVGAHRLAWAFKNDAWPAGVIDHRNGLRADNRISNLRDTTRRVNSENQRKAMVDNGTGFLGVCFEKQTQKFKASIISHGRGKTLGRFDTPEQAHAVYLEAKRHIHAGCTL